MKSSIRLFLLVVIVNSTSGLFSQQPDYWPVEGWLVKTPEEVGMKNSWLDLMQQKIETSMPFIDAFLIVKNGYLVYEKYYNNFTAERYHILCSSTKTITGIIIGMLLKQGLLDSVEEKIMDYFPEYKSVNSDVRLNDLTIEHMLAFTAGLTNVDDNSIPQTDMIEYYLGQPFFADPGTVFKYATPASQILSALVNKKTGKNANQFAEENLFPKLGVGSHHWPADDHNYTFGGYNSYFCPRDMLKFGFLYLNHGIWNGDTIVDPSFVAASTIAHSNGGNPHKEKYGYNWWIAENNGYHAFFAGGYGGQFIYVVPDIDMVVAITCRTDKHREDARFLINDFVVPSVLKFTSAEEAAGKQIQQLNIYPNPASDAITIALDNPERSSVSLCITELNGRIVTTALENKMMMPQDSRYIWNTRLPSGFYIVIARTGDREIIQKLVVTGNN